MTSVADDKLEPVLMLFLSIVGPCCAIAALLAMRALSKRDWQFGLRALWITITAIAIILGLTAYAWKGVSSVE